MIDFEVHIVLGSLFGDEGKGNSVQWLCKKALNSGKKPLVIRFSGGAQAGHRIVNNTDEHICSLIGSGVLLGVPTYLNENVYIDPISLKREYEILVNKGFKPKIFINKKCRVVTPYDKIADFGDENVQKHGTTGCGIHATFVRYNEADHRRGAYAMLLHKQRLTYYKSDESTFLDIVKEYYETKHQKEIDIEQKDIDIFEEACNWFYHNSNMQLSNIGKDYDITFVDDIPLKYDNFDTLIFEGSQGLLLDMDNGFMPHCTPSRVGLNAIDPKYLKKANVYLIMRSYLTRHGNGFNPEHENVIRKNYKNLFEASNFDHGPQGRFKIGILDHTLIRDAFVRSHLDNYYRMYDCMFNIVLTHMDCVNDNMLMFIDKDKITLEKPVSLYKDFYGLGFVPENIYYAYGPNSDILNSCELNFK